MQSGRTALHLAVHFGKIEIATLLVEQKADIETKDVVSAGPTVVMVRKPL